MNDYTIANEYSLPSNGKVYSKEINPLFKIRSMTTQEEMKRLNHTNRPYAPMAEIIDDCLVEPIGISAYDLCLPDFQYMMHKLRIVTYGSEYKVTTTCPFCGSVNDERMNLDDLDVVPFDEEEFKKYSEIVLPVTKHELKLRMQTPRILDNMTVASAEEKRKKQKFVGDPMFIQTLRNFVETVDGKKLEQFQLDALLQKLPMMDTNYLMKCAEKLITSFGIDSKVTHVCDVCGLDYTSQFRTTSEFFGPSID